MNTLPTLGSLVPYTVNLIQNDTQNLMWQIDRDLEQSIVALTSTQ